MDLVAPVPVLSGVKQSVSAREVVGGLPNDEDRFGLLLQSALEAAGLTTDSSSGLEATAADGVERRTVPGKGLAVAAPHAEPKAFGATLLQMLRAPADLTEDDAAQPIGGEGALAELDAQKVGQLLLALGAMLVPAVDDPSQGGDGSNPQPPNDNPGELAVQAVGNKAVSVDLPADSATAVLPQRLQTPAIDVGLPMPGLAGPKPAEDAAEIPENGEVADPDPAARLSPGAQAKRNDQIAVEPLVSVGKGQPLAGSAVTSMKTADPSSEVKLGNADSPTGKDGKTTLSPGGLGRNAQEREGTSILRAMLGSESVADHDVEGRTARAPVAAVEALPKDRATGQPTMGEFRAVLREQSLPQVTSAPATTVAMPPYQAESPSVIDQVLRHARVFATSGRTGLMVQLEPESLGKLDLRMVVDRSGLTLNLLAENHDVKKIIEANLPQLRSAFADQGMRLDRLVVEVNQQTLAGFDTAPRQGQTDRGTPFSTPIDYAVKHEATLERAETTAGTDLERRGGIDLRV